MSLISKAFHGVGDLVHGATNMVKDDLKKIGTGVKDLASGAAGFTKAALNGDGKGAIKSLVKMGKGGFDVYEGGKGLTPEGFATDALMKGGLEAVKQLASKATSNGTPNGTAT